MRGTSRGAAAAGEKALNEVFGSLDSGQLAEELFASCGSIDGNATLRRALTDPSREGERRWFSVNERSEAPTPCPLTSAR